ERPDEVGIAMSRMLLDERTEAQFLAQTLDTVAEKDHIPARLRLAWGYIRGVYRRDADAWVQKAIRLKEISWDSRLYANLALGLPANGHTWDLLDGWGEKVENEYWLRASIHHLEEPERDGERSIRRLLKAGRPYRALDLAGMCIRTKKDEGEDSVPIST